MRTSAHLQAHAYDPLQFDSIHERRGRTRLRNADGKLDANLIARRYGHRCELLLLCDSLERLLVLAPASHDRFFELEPCLDRFERDVTFDRPRIDRRDWKS